MQVSPVCYMPVRNTNVKLQSKNVSFTAKRSEDSKLSHKKLLQAELLYKHYVLPESEKAYKKINAKMNEAKDLYHLGKHRGFTNFANGTMFCSFEEKSNRLGKTILIDVNNTDGSRKEIEVTANKKVKIKEFKPNGRFDLYEYDHNSGRTKLSENVIESILTSTTTFDADRVFTFEGDELVRYDESYHFVDWGRGSKVLDVDKRYNLEAEDYSVEYIEGFHDNFGLRRATSDFSGFINVD